MELQLIGGGELLHQGIGGLQILDGLKGVLEHQIKTAPDAGVPDGPDGPHHILLGLIAVEYLPAHPL